MQTRYDITKNSYVLVTTKDTCGQTLYTAQHFKNGCGRGLEGKTSTSLKEIENWILKLRSVLNE